MNDYLTQILGPDSEPSNMDPTSIWMEEVSNELRKLNKRMKHKGDSEKKDGKKKAIKKMKKRLRNLERENQQLQQLILFSTYQSQMQAPKLKKHKKGKKSKNGKKAKETPQLWWQEAVTNSLPKALELATVSMNRLPSKSQPIPALPEAHG